MSDPTASQPLPTIAILSIGQMGLGIASLLLAHSYRVITNVSDRSPATQARAHSANIETLQSDEEVVRQADYIFSIVPPRDAVGTARRIQHALESQQLEREIWYFDLNAISPRTARSIASLFASSSASPAKSVHFVDAGIIGGPPSLSPSTSTWTKPDIPFSTPTPLPHAALETVLNMRNVGPAIGTASGLKCCFAALSKGFTALALQSFTTAHALGVGDALESYLDVYNPEAGEKARKGVVGCTGKAYRWVEEMVQIGECFAEEGGWEGRANVFREIAGVFGGLADVVEREGREGMGDCAGVVGVLGKGLKRGD